MKIKMKVFFHVLLMLVFCQLWSGVAAADIIYNVNINTSSISGTLGNLDFTFAGGIPVPPAGTVMVSDFLSGGTLGIGELTGDASGSLASQVLINNTPGYNDFFTPFTYGNTLKFSLTFSGPAVDTPDPDSGGSTFVFSMLDNADPLNSLLSGNQDGFAFFIDLDNGGFTTESNFMPPGTGTISLAPPIEPVPIPGTLGLVSAGLATLGVLRRLRG